MARRSSAGIGLAKTVPAVTHWNFSTTRCGLAVALLAELLLRRLAQQVGAQEQVARAEGVPFAPEDDGDPLAEGGEVGGLGLVDDLRGAVGAGDPDGGRAGPGGDRHDVGRRHDPGQALAELPQDRVAVVVAEPIGLVQDDDRPLPLPRQGRQGLELGADQVVVEDEQEQVGPRGQVAGLALAGRPPLADLGEAGGVGQEDLPLDPLDRMGVGLAAAGRPHRGLGGADGLADQGVDERGLARRAGPEDDDAELVAAPVGPERGELGVEADLGRLVADLRDDPLGLLGLHLGRADDVLRRLRRGPLGPPERPEQPRRHQPRRQRDDPRGRHEGQGQRRRVPFEPVVHLADRHDQPGRRAERDGHQDQGEEKPGRSHASQASGNHSGESPHPSIRRRIRVDCAISGDSLHGPGRRLRKFVLRLGTPKVAVRVTSSPKKTRGAEAKTSPAMAWAFPDEGEAGGGVGGEEGIPAVRGGDRVGADREPLGAGEGGGAVGVERDDGQDGGAVEEGDGAAGGHGARFLDDRGVEGDRLPEGGGAGDDRRAWSSWRCGPRRRR